MGRLMRLVRGGLVVGMLVLVARSALAADAAPVAAPGTSAASEAECKVACGPLVARCAAVFGPAMGDMRPFCERAVVRRCRAGGVAVCASDAPPAR